MKANYVCPICRTFLNIRDQIVILAKNEKGNKGILLFSIHLGNYKVIKHPCFDIEKGEKLSLFCPYCRKSLKNSKIHNNIFKILMQDDEDQEYEILFSGIYGERCTYQIIENKVSHFGQDAEKYINFINLINWS